MHPTKARPDKAFTWATNLLAALFLLFASVFPANAQNQSEEVASDKITQLPVPGRAAMLSAALPGLGQAYNGAFWKIPIIYAGFGGVVFAVQFNQNQYNTWRSAFIAKVDGNPNTIDPYPTFSNDAVRRVMEFYRRNLELSYIAGVALYLLNILDANVQAHLMDFDVGDDLTMRISPSVSHINAYGLGLQQVPALKLTFRF